MRRPHIEAHNIDRVGWLRAAVLGANDGIVSTASLIVGVAAAAEDRSAVLIAGVAALVAGAMSMAAGEYVSVSSQSDAERADLARERRELRDDPELELQELTQIYIARGVEPTLAKQVAEQMTAKDALGAHARDELGITDMMQARPVQAAAASAASFALGAALPLLVVVISPLTSLMWTVPAASLVFLVLLGGWSARQSGFKSWKPVGRTLFWGAFAMAVTAWIGSLFGAVV